MVAIAKGDNVFKVDQRAATFDVGQERRPVAGDEGEIHRGALTIGLRLGLKEIGISVDEQ
jgi:hypothetical protein